MGHRCCWTSALRAAQGAGVRRGEGARTGMVTVIQRFGSKLNLNMHLRRCGVLRPRARVDQSVRPTIDGENCGECSRELIARAGRADYRRRQCHWHRVCLRQTPGGGRRGGRYQIDHGAHRGARHRASRRRLAQRACAPRRSSDATAARELAAQALERFGRIDVTGQSIVVDGSNIIQEF